ncbi:MAG: single-stranded DNA-binding protein [Candidatus Kerfeldbacteria bacterium]|nr:single-stranded DNA-binding protein [Candidatus Kerfeldbacteria bacterium]
MDLNKVTLIGNLSKEPEQKQLNTGSTVTRLNLATNYVWKDNSSGEKKQKVDFHTIIGWNRLGQRMKQYLKKGDKIYIEGRIDNRTYQNKEGKTQYFTDIVAQRLIMLGSGKKNPTATVVEEADTDPVPLEDSPF